MCVAVLSSTVMLLHWVKQRYCTIMQVYTYKANPLPVSSLYALTHMLKLFMCTYTDESTKHNSHVTYYYLCAYCSSRGCHSHATHVSLLPWSVLYLFHEAGMWQEKLITSYCEPVLCIMVEWFVSNRQAKSTYNTRIYIVSRCMVVQHHCPVQNTAPFVNSKLTFATVGFTEQLRELV